MVGEELETSELAFRVGSQTNSMGLCTKAKVVYSGEPGPHWSPAVPHRSTYPHMLSSQRPHPPYRPHLAFGLVGVTLSKVGERQLEPVQSQAVWQGMALEEHHEISEVPNGKQGEALGRNRR